MENLKEQARISAVKVGSYKFELYEGMKGPVAHFTKLLSSGKNKGTYKTIERFRFANEDRRRTYIETKIANITANLKSDAERAAIKKAARENIVHPYKVGDVIYNSWGYEQTNIDFYEVIELKAKSVVIQEIGSSHVASEGLSSMAGMVKPDPAFRGDIQTKPIIVAVYNGKASYYVKARHGCFGIYEKGERGVYSSWYA